MASSVPYGKAWTSEEVAQMLTEVSEKKTVEEIAKLHSRTVNAVNFKLAAAACNSHLKDSKTVEEASEITGLTVDAIQAALEQRKPRPAPVAVKATAKTPVVVVKPAKVDLQQILNKVNEIQKSLTAVIKNLH